MHEENKTIQNVPKFTVVIFESKKRTILNIFIILNILKIFFGHEKLSLFMLIANLNLKANSKIDFL